jgi:hypothetical protein
MAAVRASSAARPLFWRLVEGVAAEVEGLAVVATFPVADLTVAILAGIAFKAGAFAELVGEFEAVV